MAQWTAIVDADSYEVTTLRQDVETDGRHAKVVYGTSWEADARRRDLTINALYLEADGTVVDPLGGMPDVLSGTVRFIDDAEMRIREDYLRILRFFPVLRLVWLVSPRCGGIEGLHPAQGWS